MTLFKMIAGRFLGYYYQIVTEISLWKAIFFTIPIVVMKTTFLTVFLAVICYEYENEVLNKDHTSNINIKKSIFFCNLSTNKRMKNKRALDIVEQNKMQKLGRKDLH